METFWNDLNVYAQSGFTQINALQGLLIAIGAAYFLRSWSGVFVIALGAVVVHAIFDVMLPVLANGAAFHLPPLVDGAYWRYLLTLYVGYLIVITVFYVVKRMVVNRGYEHA